MPKQYQESDAGVKIQYIFDGYYTAAEPLDSILAIKKIDSNSAYDFRDFLKKHKECKDKWPSWGTDFYRVFGDFQESPECYNSMKQELKNVFTSHPIRSRVLEAARPNAAPDYDKIVADEKLSILSLNFRVDHNWSGPQSGISLDHIAKISQNTRQEVEQLTGAKFKETSPSHEKFQIAALDYSLTAQVRIATKPVQLEFREILFESEFKDPAWLVISKELGKYDVVIINGHGGTGPENLLDKIRAKDAAPRIALLNGCDTFDSALKRRINRKETDYIAVEGFSPFLSYSFYTTLLLKQILKAGKYRDYLTAVDLETKNAIRKAQILIDAIPRKSNKDSSDDDKVELPKPPTVFVLSRNDMSQ